MVEGGGSCIIFVHERVVFLATLSNIFSYLSIKKKYMSCVWQQASVNGIYMAKKREFKLES